ncbi:MAG: T9SS type A sorting domain-containing protein [Saprospiraceae bacterium]|nr:T9SS type A sorting domain-containing protein [Saprospiraceae bacterium]
MKKIGLLLLVWLMHFGLSAQMVYIDPATGGGEDEITLFFNAAQGNKELVGASSVYVHHGVVTDNANGTAWKYVKGNWGQDDGIGKMTKIGTDLWQLKLSPNVRSYFGVPAAEKIYRISCVIRSADGSKKATMAAGNYGWGTVTTNQDIYINLNANAWISIDAPASSQLIASAGEKINFKATTSSNVSTMKLLINEGNGWEEKVTVTSGRNISYDYTATTSKTVAARVEAVVQGQGLNAEKSFDVVVRNPDLIAALPAGVLPGININDTSSVTLVLEAPAKKYVYAVGDFSNWKYQEKYQMTKTPDGRYFWITLDGLQPGKDYVFQYWVDGNIKIGDPYAVQVADPWNDSSIGTVFPNLPSYNKTEYGIATVLNTKPATYTWGLGETLWQRPKADHLVIYELHVRDFLKSHSFLDLIDTLSYFKKLGIDAIELMPVNEFEGNDSWGYNPSYFFAVDKYYGRPNDLRALIEAAHEQGIAVIMDIVLNHAFGQNPMLQLYFDGSKPTADSPWFNREYVGQYQWGYDFNHESPYTKTFVDRVNRYWLEEFHFDGFRFDFTKGFTNYAPNGSVDGFDQSRINLLKRMGDKIKEYDKDAYIILEHWAPAAEESILAGYGYKMWRNRSYDVVPATTGAGGGSFSDMGITSHVTYFDSHDERRLAEHVITEGLSKEGYNTKTDEIMYERVKMAAAFTFLFTGPKMIWQFDELGYDIDINLNGRLGRKPLPWGNGGLGYYENELRQHIFTVYKEVLKLRKTLGADKLAAASQSHKLTGNTRRLVYNTTGTDLVVLGNFGLSKESLSPSFTGMGWWYNYFTGDSLQVTNVSTPIELLAGEWRVYTSTKMSNGLNGVVENYQNPVTISPAIFTQDQEITLTFDAQKASKAGTTGLVGASKVYFHSGVVKDAATGVWSKVVGTLKDDGLGEMTSIGNDKWQIKLTPVVYYNLNASEDIQQLAMYFRDADNVNKGKGFRDKDIYWDVASNDPFITIDPPAFDIDEEITITFNAGQGNKELLNSNSIYLHSGVGLVDTPNPQSTAWNKVVGNWGQDDGVGKMTRVAGTNKYQIKIKPRTYYGLKEGDFPYWIAAVFRSPDGSKKGTGSPGPLTQGFIASNLDFFLKNQGTTSVQSENEDKWLVYPNPATDKIFLNEPAESIRVYDISGKLVWSGTGQEIEVNKWPKATYILHANVKNKILSTVLVVK